MYVTFRPWAMGEADKNIDDYKSDKLLRKYAAGIERALHAWEGSPEEWADYIALLGQLSRVGKLKDGVQERTAYPA